MNSLSIIFAFSLTFKEGFYPSLISIILIKSMLFFLFMSLSLKSLFVNNNLFYMRLLQLFSRS